MILRRLSRTDQASRPMSRDAEQAFSHRGAPGVAERLTPALTGPAPAARSGEKSGVRVVQVERGCPRAGSGVERNG
jgi:hypothetical protein